MDTLADNCSLVPFIIEDDHPHESQVSVKEKFTFAFCGKILCTVQEVDAKQQLF